MEPGRSDCADRGALCAAHGVVLDVVDYVLHSVFLPNLGHLKEDLKTITDLQLEGKLTEDETVFYFFRMHDFDDNNKLDGWELLAAMKHMSDHGHNKDNAETGISETVAAVDALMMFDKNEDGFLEYAELRSSTEEP